jgi:hypothetical protein
VRVGFSLDTLPTGSGDYATISGRQLNTTTFYSASAWIKSTGVVVLVLKQGSTTLTSTTVPGLAYTPGTQLQLRFQVTGTAPTTLRAKIWRSAEAEPSGWQSTTTDATAALQVPGTIGVHSYLSGTATATVVTRFDDFSARRAD